MEDEEDVLNRRMATVRKALYFQPAGGPIKKHRYGTRKTFR